MNAELVAPRRMKGRDQADQLLSALPDRLDGVVVRLDVPDGALPTPSFLDQLVEIVLLARGAERLVVARASDFTASILEASAVDHGVADQVEFIGPA